MGTRSIPTAALAAAVVVLAGCGGSGGSNGSADGATTTTATATTTAPAETVTTAPTTGAKQPATRTITVRVVGGKPQGGIERPEISRNESIVLVVSSDVADEVHLHGYDVSRPVAAGGVARLPFVATIPGRFEVELEESGVQIAELTVR